MSIRIFGPYGVWQRNGCAPRLPEIGGNRLILLMPEMTNARSLASFCRIRFTEVDATVATGFWPFLLSGIEGAAILIVSVGDQRGGAWTRHGLLGRRGIQPVRRHGVGRAVRCGDTVWVWVGGARERRISRGPRMPTRWPLGGGGDGVLPFRALPSGSLCGARRVLRGG